MKIENLKINNYRSLMDFTIDFTDTTILFGLNNVGKSNVLKGLCLIFARKKKLLDDGGYSSPENFYQGVVENFINNTHNRNQDDIEFTVIVSVLPDELSFENSITELNIDVQKHIFEIKGRIKQHTTAYDTGTMFLEDMKLNGKEIFSQEINTGILTFFPVFDKDRNRQGDFSSAFANLIDPLNDCVEIINSERGMQPTLFNADHVNVEEINPATFKSFLYGLYLDNPRHPIFEQIDTVLNQEPFRFGTLSFAKDNLHLEIMIKNDGLRLPISDLGSSVNQLLFIISYLIYMKSKIICIEELEQNLSPKLQGLALRKIQSMISRDGLNQIILSSHTPSYANLKYGTVYFLEKTDNVTTARKEIDKISAKFKKHIAPPYPKEEFAEIQKMVRILHDFK